VRHLIHSQLGEIADLVQSFGPVYMTEVTEPRQAFGLELKRGELLQGTIVQQLGQRLPPRRCLIPRFGAEIR
jgi:hypothetical protein